MLLLAVTAMLLFSRGDTDRVPYSEPIAQMPRSFLGLSSYDIPIDDETLSILGKGDFLNRVYTDSVPGVQPVSSTAGASTHTPNSGLFIGYFPTQRTGQSIHSPQHCLPGAGWAFESSRYTWITADDGKRFHVGEYVISDGTVRQFVLYWYQAHGRSVPNEYAAKLYMIADAIRYNRTDGALVRVISPVQANESIDAARERVVKFTGQMAPSLGRFIPD
jgi:EpsI family protein